MISISTFCSADVVAVGATSNGVFFSPFLAEDDLEIRPVEGVAFLLDDVGSFVSCRLLEPLTKSLIHRHSGDILAWKVSLRQPIVQ